MTYRLLRAILIFVFLVVPSVSLLADGTSEDKLLGYKWKPVLLSSYKNGQATEVEENLYAFKELVKLEKDSGEGKYIPDIINGFWFYASAHSWSKPSETDGKLPPREGQVPTVTSLETADMLIEAWQYFSEEINKSLPALEPALSATIKRIAGKDLK